jgi:hypothetical protein
VDGQTVRGDFDGGALSSDVGPLLWRSVDQHIGLTERLAAAVVDPRHSSYVRHEVADLLAQRTYQVASAYEDGNDANTLRHDPMFQMGVGRHPRQILIQGLLLVLAPGIANRAGALFGASPTIVPIQYRRPRAGLSPLPARGPSLRTPSSNTLLSLGF